MAEVVITGQFLLATQRTDGRPYQTGSASKATNKLSKRSNQQPRQQTQNRWDGQAGRQAGRQGLWVNRIPDRHTDAEANGKLQVCCNLVNGRGERTRTARNLCAFQEAPLFTGRTEDGVWSFVTLIIAVLNAQVIIFLHQSNWIYCTFSF